MDMTSHVMDGSIDEMMLWHVVAMNVAAPALAFALKARMPATVSGSIFAATAVQLALLWGWHSPAMMIPAMQSHLLGIAMHATLFLAAFWFWSAVMLTPDQGIWRAIIALLVTAKLFCLLGILFAFGSADVYQAAGHAASQAGLDKQQTAGLIMLAICPLSYVAIGIGLTARWFAALTRSPKEIPDQDGTFSPHRR